MRIRIKYKVLWTLMVGSLFIGCSSPRTSSPSSLDQWIHEENRIRVLSTIGMINDLVSQIGGERIVALCLLGGEIDPHSYEMVKGDSEKLSAAKIIFYNGLGLEHGASIRYQLEHHPQAVALGEAIVRQVPTQVIQIDGEIDPHIWMDIHLWSYIIDPIVEALSLSDPEGRSVFEANGQRLRLLLEKEHEAIYQAFQQIPENRRYLVTSHDAFNYFARAYLRTPDEQLPSQWEKRFVAPEGLAPDGQMSTSDIQNIIDHLFQYQIQEIFSESNVSSDSLKKIVQACQKKNMTVRIDRRPLYGDAMGGEGSGAATYLEMMQYNAQVLCEAWQS